MQEQGAEDQVGDRLRGEVMGEMWEELLLAQHLAHACQAGVLHLPLLHARHVEDPLAQGVALLGVEHLLKQRGTGPGLDQRREQRHQLQFMHSGKRELLEPETHEIDKPHCQFLVFLLMESMWMLTSVPYEVVEQFHEEWGEFL